MVNDVIEAVLGQQCSRRTWLSKRGCKKQSVIQFVEVNELRLSTTIAQKFLEGTILYTEREKNLLKFY